MLKSLQINNFLSFGPKADSVALRPLNVLVGPNGSGKSNFLSAIKILQRIPDDVSQFWKSANAPEDWFWGQDPKRNIQLVTCFEYVEFKYFMEISLEYNHMVVRKEILGNSDFSINRSGGLFESSNGVRGNVGPSRSLFATHREISADIENWIGLCRSIKIYSDRPHGDRNFLRNPQSIDTTSDFLSEQFDNLPMVLHELNNKISIEALLLDKLQKFYPRVERLYMGLVGGRAQVFFQERVGDRLMNVPASRLSDGTLSFLCLLTILCHPTPPPLICIEEPELGLHPDVLPLIAELLVEASTRTQLIVTTHSDLLVSAIGKRDPEAILVCEHSPEEGTTMTRPKPERLQKWLGDGEESLGELWLRGAIGGTLY
jgi:predicted ATPase